MNNQGKKKIMDYQRIIDVCKIIAWVLTFVGVVVTFIGLWAYFKNKEINDIQLKEEEIRKVTIDDSINVTNLKYQI